MKEAKLVCSAEGGTFQRAAESMRPDSERVCHDPLARDFLGALGTILIKSSLGRRLWVWVSERYVPGMYNVIAVRTKYIDDCLAACIDDGIDQFVNLGSGHDSRAYTFDGLKKGVRVFEVELPATLKVKMNRVKRIFGTLPKHVVYVPINFEKEELGERLFASGYNRNAKTLFLWEAVTYYLTMEAVEDILAFVANNSGDGSSIIFDYLFASVLDGTCQEEGVKAWQKWFERGNGRLSFGMEADCVEEFLADRGFEPVKNVTGQFLKSTYFKGRNESRRVFCNWGIVHAIVKPR